MPPGTEWSPPSAAWWFLRVVSGAAYWLGRPNPLCQDPGSLLVVPSPVEGCVRASQIAPTRIAFFGFVPDTIVGVFSVSDRSSIALPTRPGESEARIFPPGHPLAVELANLSTGRAASGSLLFRCQLLGFAVRVLNSIETVESNGGGGSGPASQQRRLEVLVKRLSESDLVRMTGEELAQHCGCSVRHFRRLFRQVMGISLQEKQSKLRMLKARQLLLESDLPVVEVALACGFHHQSLFHSMFKASFGVTPGQWRSTQKSAPNRGVNGGHPLPEASHVGSTELS